ncbi:MAG: TIGR04255 family protein [Lachnospiraceae bacterium]|nr:TIGR04255 family protein [Lachnospiraceae bacterium]
MNNSEIENLKNSFLKKIELKLFFRGLRKNEILEGIDTIRGELLERGFSIYEDFDEKVEYDFMEKNLGEKLVDFINPICRYANKNGTEILIASDCVQITDKIENYKSIKKYTGIFTLLIMALKKVSGYFVPMKMYVRKVNICYLRELEHLNEYFSQMVFPEYMFKNELDMKEVIFSDKNIRLNKEEVNVEFNTQMQFGEAYNEKKHTSEELYQIILDYIVYVDDSQIIKNSLLEQADFDTYLERMNNMLDDIYLKSLTRDFLVRLCNRNFSDKKIVGVTPNEQNINQNSNKHKVLNKMLKKREKGGRK